MHDLVELAATDSLLLHWEPLRKSVFWPFIKARDTARLPAATSRPSRPVRASQWQHRVSVVLGFDGSYPISGGMCPVPSDCPRLYPRPPPTFAFGTRAHPSTPQSGS